jgi:hypothetical protein
MIADPAHYGSLGPVVEAAGWLVSSAAAIGFGWRRRAGFEPAEIDIPKAGPRVSGLLASVTLAVLYSQFANSSSIPVLDRVLGWASAITLVSLLIYGYLVSVYTYEKKVSQAPAPPSVHKVIGGFWLIPRARTQIREKGLTIQRYFAGCGYHEDEVWSPEARGIAKQVFLLAYLGLTVCGTNALSAAAILLLLKK